MQQVVKFTADEVKTLLRDHLNEKFKGFDCTVEGFALEGELLVATTHLGPRKVKSRAPRKLKVAGEAAVNA